MYGVGRWVGDVSLSDGSSFHQRRNGPLEPVGKSGQGGT